MLRVILLCSLATLALALDPPFPGARQACYETETDGVQGYCEHDNCCAYSYYVSGLCGDYPANVIIPYQ